LGSSFLASTLAGAAETGADEVAGREPAAALRASAYLKLKPDENDAAARFLNALRIEWVADAEVT